MQISDGLSNGVGIKSVGIIGYGNFGAFVHELIKRFAPDVSVKVFTPDTAVDGVSYFAREEAAQCDVVVFAVPIRAYENALKETVPLMKKGGIIVDVATVKMHTVALLKKYADGRPYIATHPMFGPESYVKRNKDVSGFRIVITDHTLPEDDVLVFCKTLEQTGFRVLRMSADMHDRQLAETLFLTHFIGQIVTRAGFVRTDIDTVSFGFLMDAVESVKNDTQLFRDVFTYNPHCKSVMERFRVAQEHVTSSLN
jgi:prephenate dehydrogenase